MKSHNAAVAKRQLPRLAIDATPYTYDLESPSSSVPTSGSSAQASISTSVDTPYSAGYFHVLCLYDYEATDSDQLSFRRNEVLEIVQQEASVRPLSCLVPSPCQPTHLLRGGGQLCDRVMPP